MQPYVSDAARRKLPLGALANDGVGRSELAAAIGVAVVLAQVLFAQVTLVLTVGFLITGRLSRWRPVWLAVPAAAGFAWVLVVGERAAVAGFSRPARSRSRS